MTLRTRSRSVRSTAEASAQRPGIGLGEDGRVPDRDHEA